MVDPGSMTRLAQDLQSDENAVRQDAATKLWERYSNDLLALASRHLDVNVRRREDEFDVVQDAFKSFCLRHQRGEFHLDNRNELWKLLVTITLCKARNTAEHHAAAKRNYRREAASNGAGTELPDPLAQLGSVAPGPQEMAMFQEQFENLVLGLPEELRRIALWKLEGYTNAEIAAKVGCVKRSVIRKSALIRDRWMNGIGTEQPR